MRALVPISLALTGVAPAVAQVSIGNGVVRSGDTVIDANGVHTATARIDRHGVREHGGTVSIRSNRNHRAVTCGGGTLAVQGNDNVLEVSGCERVDVDGNGNTVHARFVAPASLGVMGNRNVVAWSAPRDVRVGVSNLGTGNQVTRR